MRTRVRQRITLITALLLPIALASTAFAAFDGADDPAEAYAARTPAAAAESFGRVAPETITSAGPEFIAGKRIDAGVRDTPSGFVITGVPGREVIGDDADEGFALATTAGRLAILPEDVSDEAGAPTLVPATDAVVTVNSGLDSDTLVRPAHGGVETFTLIRSPESPEAFRWHVSLPGQESLRMSADGGADVLGARGVRIATIAAPWARDASGDDVPVSFQVDADTLTMTVAHRDANVAYPVVADPSWLPAWMNRAGGWVARQTRRAAPAFGRCLSGGWATVRTGPKGNPWLIAGDAVAGCVVGAWS